MYYVVKNYITYCWVLSLTGPDAKKARLGKQGQPRLTARHKKQHKPAKVTAIQKMFWKFKRSFFPVRSGLIHPKQMKRDYLTEFIRFFRKPIGRQLFVIELWKMRLIGW